MSDKIYFSVDEVNQILGALGKLPAEQSMNIILYIKNIAEPQLPKEEVVEEAEVVSQ